MQRVFSADWSNHFFQSQKAAFVCLTARFVEVRSFQEQHQ